MRGAGNWLSTGAVCKTLAFSACVCVAFSILHCKAPLFWTEFFFSAWKKLHARSLSRVHLLCVCLLASLRSNERKSVGWDWQYAHKHVTGWMGAIGWGYARHRLCSVGLGYECMCVMFIYPHSAFFFGSSCFFFSLPFYCFDSVCIRTFFFSSVSCDILIATALILSRK